METTKSSQNKSSQNAVSRFWRRISQFSSRYKSEMGLAVLLLYVFLLGLGTVGEVWDIEWILDLPVFRPPGKY